MNNLIFHPKKLRKSLNIFYRNYPEIATYRESIIDSVAKNSYVTTLSGRRRYLGEINHEKYQVREFAKRAATNAPIQGTAADLIKLAMIKVDEYLTSNQLKSRLVLQIHDELVFKVHKDEKDMVIGHVKSLMENALPLDVKCKSNIKLAVHGLMLNRSLYARITRSRNRSSSVEFFDYQGDDY